MNILAVIGSYRKGRTIETLADKAIEGAAECGATVEKVRLIEKRGGKSGTWRVEE